MTSRRLDDDDDDEEDEEEEEADLFWACNLIYFELFATKTGP